MSGSGSSSSTRKLTASSSSGSSSSSSKKKPSSSSLKPSKSKDLKDSGAKPAPEAAKKKKIATTVIQRRFGLLLDAMGLPPGIPKRDELDKLSWKDKHKMIKEWKTDGPKLDSDILTYIDLFKEKLMDVDKLDELREKLSTMDADWVTQFIQCNGVLWLFECFSYHVYNLGTIRGGDTDLDMLELCVECLRDMLNNEMSGLKELIAIPYSFNNIIDSLSYVALWAKADLFDLLSAILLVSSSLEDSYSADVWSTVTNAVHTYKATKPHEFSALLEELEEGDDALYKIAFLTFINTMIVQGNTLADRVGVRQDFMDEGITDILKELRETFGEDTGLQEQITAFDEELESDGKELKDKSSVRKTTTEEEGVEIAKSLYGKLKGSAVENSYVSTLRHLLHMTIGYGEDEAVGKKLWAVIDKYIQQFDLTGNASGLTYYHLLAAHNTSLTGTDISEKEKGLFDEIASLKKEIEDLKTQLANAPAGVSTTTTSEEEGPVETGGPPPPMSGAPPPPGGGPPPPGGGPPGPPGGPPGSSSVKTFKDPDRPAMLPWRWERIPPGDITSTVFEGLAEASLDLTTIIKTAEIENVFALKKALPSSALAAALAGGIEGSGSGTGGEGGSDLKKKIGSAAKKEAILLKNPQRCNIIMILMHRFKEPIEEIIKYIDEISPRILTKEKLSELRGLFPSKIYKEESDMFLNYAKENKDPSEFINPERIMYELYTKIPRVYEKVNSLYFCLDANDRLDECVENAATVSTAFEELRSRRLKKVLELALAIGNYVNNPTQQIQGFRISSLLKLNDVVSKNKSKFTLMNHLAAIVESEYKDLLLFPDELTHVSAAALAFESLQAEYSSVKSDLKIVSEELENMKNSPEDTDDLKRKKEKWIQYLSANVVQFSKKVENVQKHLDTFDKEAKYFGEPNAALLSDFFLNWDKFVQYFQTAVKFNITVQRKEEALEKKQKALARKEELLAKKRDAKRAKKDELKKKKEEIKKRKAMAKAKKEESGAVLSTSGGHKSKKPSSSSSASGGSGGSSSGTKPSVAGIAGRFGGKVGDDKKKLSSGTDVDGVVSDLFAKTPGTGSSISDRRSAGGRGTVNQLVLTLRTSTKFNNIRGSRIHMDESTDEQLTLDTEARLVKQVSSRLPKIMNMADLAKLS